MADTKMVAPEGKKTKMVKVKALRDFTYRTGAKTSQRLPNGNEVVTDEEKFARVGEVHEMPQEEADAVCLPFTGSYAFGGERGGDEGKARHVLRRGQVIPEAPQAA
jgi:hypothetical protein